jgi:hypothetical protein
MPSNPSSCVVLVPIGGAVDPGCDDGLRELEKRGYPVWRVRGYSAARDGRRIMRRGRSLEVRLARLEDQRRLNELPA